MNPKYYMEIVDGDAPSPYDWFAYFDTDEYLAHFLFKHENVEVEVEGEYGKEEDPYRIILCRVPRKDRHAFLKVMNLLPAFMAYAGKTDYESYCREKMLEAWRYRMKSEAAGEIPVQ